MIAHKAASRDYSDLVILLIGKMVYVKSILVGLGAAILSQILLAAVAIMINMRELAPGIGAIVGVSGSSALIVGLIMFAVGFSWQFRRSLRKSSPREKNTTGDSK